MPTLLLTRPRTESERLANILRGMGYACVIEPLLSIMPTEMPSPDMDGIGSIMITSSAVFPALERDRQRALHLLELPCFCIGSNTAERAEDFGFRTVYDAAGDGTSLATLIEQKADVIQGILHIAGVDVDGSAQEELHHMGFAITSWPVYEAKPATQLSATTIALFKQSKIDAAPVFSSRTAATFKALVMQHGLETCCAGLTAIGISETVTAVLEPLPWRKLAAAPSPNEDAVIKCLHDLVPVSGVP